MARLVGAFAWLFVSASAVAQAPPPQPQPQQQPVQQPPPVQVPPSVQQPVLPKTALRDRLIVNSDATDADKVDFVIRPLKIDLKVSAITVVGLSRTADGVTRPQSSTDVTSQPCTELKSGTGIVKLGTRCPVAVMLSASNGPGRYTAGIEVLAEDERELVSIAFDHSRPWYVAFGVLALGLAVGAYVGNWLNTGRDLALKAIAVKNARTDIADAAKGVPLLTELASKLMLRSEQMEREMNTIDDAELDELRLRPAQLRFIVDIDRDASHIGGDRENLNDALTALVSALAPSANGILEPVPATAVQAVRVALEAMQKLAHGNVESAARNVELPRQAFPIDMSPERAEQQFKQREWITATILALIFSAMTLVTSYYKVPVWGTPGDLLTMFLIGFGAYAGSIASVSAFLKRSATSSF